MKIHYKYWTKAPGIDGKITKPGDFIVKEIISPKFLRKYERTSNGMKPLKGKYSLFLLKKTNLTTLEAVKRLSKLLKIPENAISYAGLKDRFAVTYQYITIKNYAPLKQGLRNKNMELSFIKMTDKQLSPGELIGNEFVITLHGCKNTENLEKVAQELNKGLPNYFGMQRFGMNKNNHIIGTYLAQKNFKNALKLINKSYIHKHKDIKDVPKKLLKFFINSYQSFLFNETLNKYIENNKKPSFGARSIKPIKINELRISCKGGSRKLFISISDINFTIAGSVRLLFKLPKGSYGTVVLREVCKNG